MNQSIRKFFDRNKVDHTFISLFSMLFLLLVINVTALQAQKKENTKETPAPPPPPKLKELSVPPPPNPPAKVKELNAPPPPKPPAKVKELNAPPPPKLPTKVKEIVPQPPVPIKSMIDSDNNDQDIEAAFPGGSSAWLRYLNKELRYPTKAIEQNIQGIVEVKFNVDEKGILSNVKGISGPIILQEEAIRVVEKSGKWIPAKKDNKPINSVRKLPIKFQL